MKLIFILKKIDGESCKPGLTDPVLCLDKTNKKYYHYIHAHIRGNRLNGRQGWCCIKIKKIG